MSTIEEHLFDNLLIRYLQNTATQEDLSKLLEIIREAEDKKDELVKLKSIYDSLQVNIDKYNYPIDKSWKKMHSLIHSTHAVKKTPLRLLNWGNKRTIMYIAAVALLLLAISISYLYHKPLSTNIPTTEYTRFVTEKGRGKSTLFLPDGTKVVLNAGTSIQYPTRFDLNERIVLLEGEGYFDVAKNRNKPFIVRLKDYDVKVLGTVFDVKAYPGTDHSTTSLISGKVQLTSYTKEGKIKDEVVLLPNETATIEKQTGAITTAVSSNELELAWIDGLYKFKDKSFADIVKELESIYNVQIEVADAALRSSLYTGSFIIGNTIEEVLAPLSKYNNFQYTKEGKRIKIYILKQ